MRLATVGFLLVAAAWFTPACTEGTKRASVGDTPGAIDRTILPVVEPVYPDITEVDARNATPPPRFEVKPTAGAPNVLII